MSLLIDLTGKRFSHLKVIRFYASDNGAVWLCKCDCGTKTTVTGRNLRHKHVTTCGRSCIYHANSGVFQETHGYSRTKLYAIYNQMMQRCYNPNRGIDYERYGARGITVYPEWTKDFVRFRKWIRHHLGKRPKGMTLDRINNDKGYFPGNLRWATRKQQANNRRPRTH